MRVALFDYGAGNLHSLKKALEAGGSRVLVTTSWDEALGEEALVLPGVGSFGAAVQALSGQQERVRDALLNGLPTLGICLGMQLLFSRSQEAEGEGIGLIPGEVRILRSRTIPQMGWNEVMVSEDRIFTGVAPLVAYFANSYVCEPRDSSTIISATEYQGDGFPSGVRLGRTWGLQFHPEKSSRAGLRIIHNFLEAVREEGERP